MCGAARRRRNAGYRERVYFNSRISTRMVPTYGLDLDFVNYDLHIMHARARSLHLHNVRDKCAVSSMQVVPFALSSDRVALRCAASRRAVTAPNLRAANCRSALSIISVSL